MAIMMVILFSLYYHLLCVLFLYSGNGVFRNKQGHSMFEREYVTMYNMSVHTLGQTQEPFCHHNSIFLLGGISEVEPIS